MVFLFIGQDKPAKDIQLARLRQEFLKKETEQFNLDILYAKELALDSLQEKLLFLPVKNPRRIVVIKGAEDLGDDSKEFLLKYVKNPPKQIVLVLDVERLAGARPDEFIRGIQGHAKTYRFKEIQSLDTFSLSRQIELKRPDYALKVLGELLRGGERPVRILGGLRYVWEKSSAPPLEAKKRLKLLLECDIDIKTGRLKPTFALEKLVVSLCGPRKVLG